MKRTISRYKVPGVLGGELAVPCTRNPLYAGPNPLPRVANGVMVRSGRSPRSRNTRTSSGPEGSSDKYGFCVAECLGCIAEPMLAVHSKEGAQTFPPVLKNVSPIPANRPPHAPLWPRKATPPCTRFGVGPASFQNCGNSPRQTPQATDGSSNNAC